MSGIPLFLRSCFACWSRYKAAAAAARLSKVGWTRKTRKIIIKAKKTKTDFTWSKEDQWMFNSDTDRWKKAFFVSPNKFKIYKKYIFILLECLKIVINSDFCQKSCNFISCFYFCQVIEVSLHFLIRPNPITNLENSSFFDLATVFQFAGQHVLEVQHLVDLPSRDPPGEGERQPQGASWTGRHHPGVQEPEQEAGRIVS